MPEVAIVAVPETPRSALYGLVGLTPTQYRRVFRPMTEQQPGAAA